MNEDLIEFLFEYHAPTPEMVEKLKAVRAAGKELALAIDANCPSSADRTAAMRELQACMNTANRSIVFEGRGYR